MTYVDTQPDFIRKRDYTPSVWLSLDFPAWMRILKRNLFHLNPKKVPLAMAITFSSLMQTLAGRLEDMIYGDQEVAESTLLWIKNYREKVSFENFFPHITIGYGQVESRVPQIIFAPSELTLCHLGNHCTCRKVLVSIKLKGP